MKKAPLEEMLMKAQGVKLSCHREPVRLSGVAIP